MSTLTAKANTGTGTDQLAVFTVPDGSAGAVVLVDSSTGAPISQPTAAQQTTANASLANIDTDLGAQADAAATTDTGTFSIIALIKRGLGNWSTLLARIPTLVTGRMPVDGSGVTQPVSGTFWQTTQPVSIATWSGLTDTQLRATALPVSGTFFQATQPISLTAGTVNPVVPATPFILSSTATTNDTLVLTGTSGLSAFHASNNGAAVAYVKLYNKATAPASTDVPAMIIPVPAGGVSAPLTPGFHGFRFALGLGIRITTGIADTDTGAVAAGQVKVMLSRTV